MGGYGAVGFSGGSGQRLRMVRPCTGRQTLPNEGGREPGHVQRSLQDEGSGVVRGGEGRTPTLSRPGQPQEETLLEGRQGQAGA